MTQPLADFAKQLPRGTWQVVMEDVEPTEYSFFVKAFNEQLPGAWGTVVLGQIACDSARVQVAINDSFVPQIVLGRKHEMCWKAERTGFHQSNGHAIATYALEPRV